MNRNSLSVFLVLALVFILSSITTSAQQPRAVPPNNNFVDAKTIKLGKDYSVPDIGAATNEFGEPVASCTGGTVIPHSVWFNFTPPRSARIYLSTFGTLLYSPQYQLTGVTLAVYRLSGPGVLTEVACAVADIDLDAAQVSFVVYSDITYYIAAGTLDNESYAPDSTLKLNTRMLATTLDSPNYSFETPVDGTDWKLKNGGDDQVVCSNATYPAELGLCTFRFTGTPGVTTKLTQTFAFPTAFRPRKNAFLSNAFYFRVMDTAALGTARARFIVSYSDGAPPSIHSTDLTGTAATNFYDFRVFRLVLKSSKVASIKFDVKFASPNGILLIDAVQFGYTADVLTRTGGLLPVPAAPAAK